MKAEIANMEQGRCNRDLHHFTISRCTYQFETSTAPTPGQPPSLPEHLNFWKLGCSNSRKFKCPSPRSVLEDKFSSSINHCDILMSPSKPIFWKCFEWAIRSQRRSPVLNSQKPGKSHARISLDQKKTPVQIPRYAVKWSAYAPSEGGGLLKVQIDRR